MQELDPSRSRWAEGFLGALGNGGGGRTLYYGVVGNALERRRESSHIAVPRLTLWCGCDMSAVGPMRALARRRASVMDGGCSYGHRGHDKDRRERLWDERGRCRLVRRRGSWGWGDPPEAPMTPPRASPACPACPAVLAGGCLALGIP